MEDDALDRTFTRRRRSAVPVHADYRWFVVGFGAGVALAAFMMAELFLMLDSAGPVRLNTTPS